MVLGGGHLVRTSCGGTSKAPVRRSTHWYWSMQGTTRKRPGPLAPPLRSLSPVPPPTCTPPTCPAGR